MLLEVLETLQGFGNGWEVAGRDPPQDENRALDGLEPLLPVAKWPNVRAAVDELLERGEGLPH
jgi:hypothetical protein